MKVFVNNREPEFREGARIIEVANLIHEAKKDEPMIKTIREKSGKVHILLFALNGRAFHPDAYEPCKLKDGDDIRWFHPYAGG